MDYNINDFVGVLRNEMYHRFPYEKNDINLMKHKGRTFNIRDVAFMNNPLQVINEDMIVFDIGNEFAEKYYPYYHILEDSAVIHKKDRGTEKSKGDQSYIENLGQRDYGKISFNGKMFSKDYDKIVGEERDRAVSYSTRYTNINGKRVKVNRASNTYENIHYHYIEKMLSIIAPLIAGKFGGQYLGQSSNGLAEEFMMDMNNLPTIEDSGFVSQILGM